VKEGKIESKRNRIKYRPTVDLKDELSELAILGPRAMDGQGQRRLVRLLRTCEPIMVLWTRYHFGMFFRVDPERYKKHGKLMLVIFWAVILVSAIALWAVVKSAK